VSRDGVIVSLDNYSIMKLLILILVALTSAWTVTGVAAAPEKKKKDHLRHVVAFKFKETATPADIAKVEDAFKALKGKIPQISKLESGLNNSPEKHNKGCTHAWILTFKSEKDRDDYLVHPDHKEFGKLVGPLLADVFVVDFWAKE
jgi:hypothetical protein